MASKTGSRVVVSAQSTIKANDNKSLTSTPQELDVHSIRSSLETSVDQEKKSSGLGSVKNSSVSTKVSDRADFVESGKSSVCRGSTSSDVSDESSCSSFSSNINKPHKANDVQWEAIQAVRSSDGVLGLSHFRLLKRLGCGDIGSVYLAELSGTKCYFAMKVMDKASLASRKKLLRAQTEREILQSLDHPFLPSLYAHFETDKFSCLVMEFCPGGDIHTLRQRQPGKYFSEQAVKTSPQKFCLLRPASMHRTNLHSAVMRCPNNMLFSSSLFYQIQRKETKNEIANQVSPLPELIAEPTNARSMSFVGTHEYLAPEIIKGEGHGSPVDWWTFGIFLYELLFGKTPFKGSGNRATLFNVVGQPLRFPESPVVSFAARDLIRGLLVKESQHRLGYKRGATEIKQHPFFGGVNWALIRCATPPEIPKPPLRFPESPVVSFAARDLIRGLLVKESQHRLGYKRGATEIKQHPFFEGVNWALIRCATPPEIPKPVDFERMPLPPPPGNEKTANVVSVTDQKSDKYLEFDFF
ncbi:hypothetical protein DH2020_033063 [Rehmannia glutinosa]|uniref:non-specific serine/threonine protein kinase n=1 Tax=Rehmannia glutinosa TaxID=99300 RepID=A0ABR0VF30_REHGL